jgi:hypothetical protein
MIKGEFGGKILNTKKVIGFLSYKIYGEVRRD